MWEISSVIVVGLTGSCRELLYVSIKSSTKAYRFSPLDLDSKCLRLLGSLIALREISFASCSWDWLFHIQILPIVYCVPLSRWRCSSHLYCGALLILQGIGVGQNFSSCSGLYSGVFSEFIDEIDDLQDIHPQLLDLASEVGADWFCFDPIFIIILVDISFIELECLKEFKEWENWAFEASFCSLCCCSCCFC